MSRGSSLVVAVGLLFVATQAFGQAASLKAPATAAVGSKLAVQWTGPDAKGDFVSIDNAGAPDSTYGPYAYPSTGNPVTLAVPDKPGKYEVRYHSAAAGYPVLAKTALVVTDVTATLEAAKSVEVGGALKVSWKGPNEQGDFISIDALDAPDRTYGNYEYPAKGNPIVVRAPDKPGEYVLRYHLGGSYRVIGSAPLTVGGVAATLEFPASAVAGGKLPVKWTGPGKKGDFISIDALDAPDRTYGNYEYPERGNPVEVRVPDEAGDYLVRYHLASSYGVVGSAPLKVEPATASLTAPAKVAARSVFAVNWKGPDNQGDFITVVAPTAKDREYGSSNGYTQRGNPVRLEAPKTAGNYELRYLTGQSYRTLAKTALVVTPSGAPAKLRVVTDAKDTAAFATVEFVLDASGSMLQKLGGTRRIDLAKSAFTDLAHNVLPDGTAFALRVFGHKEAGSCRTDLELPLAPLDRNAAVARIKGLGAMNLAKTPIGASLLKVRDDLKGAKPSDARRARHRRRGDLRRRSEGGDPGAARRRPRRARQHRRLRGRRGRPEGDVSRVGARRQRRLLRRAERGAAEGRDAGDAAADVPGARRQQGGRHRHGEWRAGRGATGHVQGARAGRGGEGRRGGRARGGCAARPALLNDGTRAAGRRLH